MLIPGSAAPLMMDVVAVAMVAVLPVLAVGVRAARRRQWQTHKRIQVTLGILLLVAVVGFEVDIRLHGWRDAARGSPFAGTPLNLMLGVHICLASAAFILWLVTLVSAHRRFASPPVPGPGSQRHRLHGRLTVIFTCLTSVSGWLFYWAAFLAR